MARKKLVIIDGYSLLFRAFYGTRYLSTSDGRPTNAIFGFINMLYLLFERERPHSLVVAFDAPGKTFRDQVYAEYKATRKETPDELKFQLQVAREIITGLGIPLIELTGYEADDIIGTIARDAKKHGYDTTIVSGDLDELQLVDENIKVMTTRTGVTDVVYYDPEGVKNRYGFSPKYLPDYKALVGDPSDNIPGVPGVGDKTATKLIQQFGPVEEIIKHLPEVEEKIRKKIEPYLNQIPQSKYLATIACDAPVKFDYEPFEIDQNEYQTAQKALESLEFRSLLRRLPQVLKPYLKGTSTDLFQTHVVAEKPVIKIEKTESLTAINKWLNEKQAALFIEGQEAAIAVGNHVKLISPNSAKKLVSEKPGAFILHHSKPLLKELSVYQPPAFDSLLAAYVLQPSRSSYLIEDLAQGYLDEPSPSNAAEKASALYRLRNVLIERLKKEDQWRVYDDIERPLTPILAEMENIGIAVDAEILQELSKNLSTAIASTEQVIYQMAGEQFTIGSPQQLGRILYDKLKLPVTKRTKTGFATGAEVLIQLAPQYPIAQEILNWREITKLKTTYADALPKMIAEDGRIHTTFAQHVAATGRLSSLEPNLQNIPIRTQLGREIRRAFVAGKGYQLISLDYSQIELRLLAHECKDPGLMDAFLNHKDVHAATAAIMWNEPIESVSSTHRRYAKLLNYAVLYGVTDWGLANQLGGSFTVAEAKELIKNYFERFPKVKLYIQKTLETARTKGFTTTITGRRRYFPDIHAGNRAARQYAERQAINAPLQGGSADLIKIAMIKSREILKRRDSRMVLQVHDELLFELAKNEDSLISPLVQAMEEAFPLDVPIEVDASIGANWLEMTPVQVKHPKTHHKKRGGWR